MKFSSENIGTLPKLGHTFTLEQMQIRVSINIEVFFYIFSYFKHLQIVTVGTIVDCSTTAASTNWTRTESMNKNSSRASFLH